WPGRGSWPEPPPEMIATLPGLRLARWTNLRSLPSFKMSPWAAAKPSRLSVSIVSILLISFFMSFPLREFRFEYAGHLTDEIGNERVKPGIPLVIAELRQIDRMRLEFVRIGGERRPS